MHLQILGGLWFFIPDLRITKLDACILTCYYVVKKRRIPGFMVSDNNQSIWPLNSKYVIFALLGILSSFLSYSSSVLVWTNTIKANRTASRERAEYFECIRRGVGEIPFRTRSSTYPHHKYPPCNTSKNVPVSVKGVGGGKKCVPASAAEVRCELCTVICKNDCWLTAPNESSQVKMDYSTSESIHLSQKWSMAMAALYKENVSGYSRNPCSLNRERDTA